MENEDLKKAVGKRIKALRRSYGLTQEQLSETIDISVTYYSLVECGNRMLSLKNLIKVSKIYSVSMDYLIFGTDKENSDIPRETALFEGLNEAEKLFANTVIMLSRQLKAMEQEFIIKMISDFINMRKPK